MNYRYLIHAGKTERDISVSKREELREEPMEMEEIHKAMMNGEHVYLWIEGSWNKVLPHNEAMLHDLAFAIRM